MDISSKVQEFVEQCEENELSYAGKMRLMALKQMMETLTGKKFHLVMPQKTDLEQEMAKLKEMNLKQYTRQQHFNRQLVGG